MRRRYVYWMLLMLTAAVAFALFLRSIRAGISPVESGPAATAHPASHNPAGGPPHVPENAEERQELVFLLQYIGRDYPNAVADGQVINDFEYREIMLFARRALELYLSFQNDRRASPTLFQLQELRELVHQKAEREAIRELTVVLVPELCRELGLASAPTRPADIEQGRQLYKAAGCAVCHGSAGAGDGPAAAWLEPGPGNFRDQETMRESTPFQFFNAIQLGVPGTGMPSFREAFTPEEVWDIAFFLMTLQQGGAPVQPDNSSP